MSADGSWEHGSQWRRWNPHIHAPGTLRNDLFNGNWDKYFDAIDNATPVVEVIGITDYFSIETYKVVRAKKKEGKLPKVKLLFPNVEMRMTVETDKQRGINIHLLFSPEDPKHEEQIDRALMALTFKYKGQPYRCTKAELISLGKAHNAAATDDHKAYCEGANQFKVSLEQLQEMFDGDAWVRQHCLVGVAASNNDGTAGLQADASFTALRREIERFSHFVFASTPKCRDFWLGRHADYPPDKLEAEYGGRRPCLHGCDAHELSKVCKVHEDRFCWIKGDPTYESLRQAILEPEERVWLGPLPPDRHDAGMCVAQIELSNTPWLKNKSILFNNGLVAIIGSRGSGKTALADIISIGTDVDSPQTLETSFIRRASYPTDLLGGAKVCLHWGDGASVVRNLSGHNNLGSKGVRYLSQQFVEQLCSSAGLAEELRGEIERVIFDATPSTDLMDADNFEMLGEIHLGPIRRNREITQKSIEDTSALVNAEDALIIKVPLLTKSRNECQAKIKKTKDEMRALLPKGKEERTKRLADLEAALAAKTMALNKQKRILVRVEDLEREVQRINAVQAPQQLEELKAEYSEAGFLPAQWGEFGMVFKGDVRTIIAKRKEAIASEIKLLTKGDASKEFWLDTPLADWSLEKLTEERDKVKKEVGIDAQNQRRYEFLRKGLDSDEQLLQRLNTELNHANGATERKKGHVQRRKEQYVEVFQTYLEEQQVLERLYGPLQTTLQGASGSLKRLRFAVSREIDLDAWVAKGESLLDLRLDSKLRGVGSLSKEANKYLIKEWKSGTAEEVGAAMQKFIIEMFDEFRKSRPTTIPETKVQEWMQKLATWLYSTDHIQMRYSITYDNVAIEHLSPGTRGIVLLLLYLVIDKLDRRPLIIDQPEENLDPKSVFDELVPHFRDARQRRQVIIVTHNANLVVNTDADQVIVASAEPNSSGGLPTVSYQCGSLENPSIRKAVCDILEGGKKAFLDRERRYRLHHESN